MATSSTAPVVCEFCEGTRWVQASNGRGVVRCVCVAASRPKHADGVPLEFRDATFGTYRVVPGNKAAVKAARAFLESPTGDLYLCGGVGAGKTRLACALLNEWHAAKGGGLFVSVPNMLLDMRLYFSREERADETAFYERLFAAPLLVLDDVAVEKPSDWSLSQLYAIYERRWAAGHRTIWTSNLDLAPDPKRRTDPNRPRTLGEFLGDDRIPSRIVGRGTVCYLNVADQRLPFNRRREDD